MTTVLFVHREDLQRHKLSSSKEDITYIDLTVEAWARVRIFDMVIFVDNDGTHKVLKNRYGRD